MIYLCHILNLILCLKGTECWPPWFYLCIICPWSVLTFLNPVFFQSNDQRPHDIIEGHAATLCLVLAGALYPARVSSLAHKVRPDEENVSASKSQLSQDDHVSHDNMSHMIRKGRVEEGRKVIQWLRGSHYAVEPEVKEMEAIAR